MDNNFITSENLYSQIWKEYKNWNIQKEYYEEEMKYANDNNIFKWNIFLKYNSECIGRISCHESYCSESNITDTNIRDVGWIIDPKYQGNGYGTEAAKAMIDFMFLECEIEKIVTGAAICNPAS